MNRKTVSRIMLTLLLIGMLTLAFNIQPVKPMDGTIYIRADGSIDPPDAPISSIDNVTYTFMGNINDSIVVERDNIVVNGAGYTIQGTGNGSGISLSERTNVTIRNMEIKAFRIGIYFDNSSKNYISENNIRENSQGIYVYGSNEPPETGSWHNTIVGNNITENGGGILLEEAKFNNVSGNNIIANHGNVDYPLRPGGIYIFLNSLGNIVSGNNIINNERYGIYFHYCTTFTPELFNVVRGNNIINNGAGIETYHGVGVGIFENNIKNNNVGLNLSPGLVTAYHNNFIYNTQQVDSGGSTNIWDDGYPSGGNYWSDYTGGDLYTGPGQNLTEGIGSDGIGDTSYVIDANNIDYYPLMIPWTSNPLIHPQEGQYANYTIRAIDLQTGTIQNEGEFNLTYHKYVSPFLMYVTSPKGYGEIYWTALNITNRYAYNSVWPITGIIKDMWFPWWIETNITIGSTIRLLNGTGTVIGDKTLNVNLRPIDCWELTCIEEITPETSLEHTFWCHKYTGLLIGQEAIYGSIKVNTTLTDTNIISLLQMPKTWTVDDDGPADFHTIQQAINAANLGDTIYVYNGTYYENVVVNKSISLVGENRSTTMIDGNRTGTVFYVTASNVTITGFTIQNSGIYEVGVLVESSSFNNISGNILWNNLVNDIFLANSSNNTIEENIITNSGYYRAIGMSFCSNNKITKNSIINNIGRGIELIGSHHNTISENVLANNGDGGIYLWWAESHSNTISGNTIKNHIRSGIYLVESDNNIIYHNNFINNTQQVYGSPEYVNFWDSGYPSGGNYWSDYAGADLYSGVDQDELGSDGIGDDPYFIDENNQDNYPLMKPWGPIETVFNVTWDEETYPVTVVSNSTITDFNFNQPLKQISFNVTGPNGSTGFCNITIPKELLNGDFTVLIDGQPPLILILTQNETHTNLYFTYMHTTHQVSIVGTTVIEEEKVLLGTGWGWMRIANKEYVYGSAKLYKIGDEQIELVIKKYSRTWNIIRHKKYKTHEIYFCFSQKHGVLIVGLHHSRWTFWWAVGKDTIALGHPRFGRLRLMPTPV